MNLGLILNWGFILVLIGLYLNLGFSLADAVHELGFLRRLPVFVGFLVIMLLWPLVLMMLADRIRLEKEWWR